MHVHTVCFIYKHKQKHTLVSFLLVCCLSKMEECLPVSWAQFVPHVFSKATPRLFFFFLFLSLLFLQTLKSSTRECTFTRQVLQSCHPQAFTAAAALRTDFAALLHSLLLPFHAPCWESFQESCLWLLAVDAVFGGFLEFFFPSELPLLADSGIYVYAESVFSVPSGIRLLMWSSFTAGSQ